MPKNKEGKTEEDRVLLLQQRALVEEERKRRKEETLSLFLQDKLRKEERNTAVNLLKISDGWRALLRLTRAGELRGGVTELSQSFERQLDSRDSVVQTLGKDLQEAELQWAQVRRVHLQLAEHLLTMQRECVALVQQQWERELQQLGRRWSEERKQLLCQSVQRRVDLDDATLTVEQKHRAAMNEVHKLYTECITAYQTSYDGRKEDLTEKDRLLKETLRNQQEKQTYTTEAQKLKDLLTVTQQLIKETDQEAQAVMKLQRVFLQREELNTTETENQSAEQDLIEARRQVSTRTRSLREQLIQDRAAARKRLNELTVQSDKAVKKLKAVIAKGLKVLRVAEMCRKLEREENVFVMFALEGRRQETTGPETKGPDKDTSELNQVRMRMNASVFRREALRKRRDDLSRDNRQLKLLLRQHMDSMMVNDQDLSTSHTLLTVHRAPTSVAPTSMVPRRHPVIEAAHAVKHSL